MTKPHSREHTVQLGCLKVTLRGRSFKRFWLFGTRMVTQLLAFAGFRYVLFGGREDLEVGEIEIFLPGLPDGLEGLRIAHLSDFHYGPYWREGDLERVVDVTLERQPDLIALTGDYICVSSRYVRPVTRTLGRLKAPLGVYAVPGNHDFYYTPYEGILNALRQEGISVLLNECCVVERNGAKMAVCGLDDFWEGDFLPEQAFEKVPKDAFSLLLVHHPDAVEELAGHRPNLTLSGHTHGGQVRKPGQPPKYTSSAYGTRFTEGLVETDSTHVFISRGIGAANLPIRRNCRPQIPILKLRQLPVG